MLLRVLADIHRCIGSGNCAFLAPHVFDVGDAGHVIVRGGSIKETDEAVLEAIASCPTNALTIEGSRGGADA